MKILAYLTKNGHPALWDNMSSLVNSLSNMGHNVRICDINNIDEAREILYSLLDNPNCFDMSVGFNSLGLEWKIVGYTDIIYPYDSVNFPHVSIMLDEPFNHCVSGYDLPCRNHVVTYLDRSDLKALDILYPDKKMKKLFMPLGGTLNEYNSEHMSEPKVYDVVVSAENWTQGTSIPRWHQEGSTKSGAAILDDVAEILMNYPISLLPAFQEVLYSRGMYDKEYLEALTPFFWPVLQFIKPWRRHQMVRCLVEAGFKVHIFGGGWQGVSFYDALIDHGAVPYRQMLDVISKTKVLVQDEAMFNDGAHDRVFSGMLNGAVVVSEYSSYLEELFEDQHDLFMFDWQHTKEQMGIIHQLLGNENYRADIARNAYKKVIKSQTWENRAERIIEAVELFGK